MVTNSGSTGEVPATGKGFKPQRNALFEFATNVDFLHKRLDTTLSFIQINENNFLLLRRKW